MQKKIGKDEKEFQFFRDFWGFYENNYYPENTDIYWDKLVKEGNDLCFKYNDISIARKLILAVIQELEERAKERK